MESRFIVLYKRSTPVVGGDAGIRIQRDDKEENIAMPRHPREALRRHHAAMVRRAVFRNDGTTIVRRAMRRDGQRMRDWRQWTVQQIEKSERGQAALDHHFGTHNLNQAQRRDLMHNNLRYREWAFILLEEIMYHPSPVLSGSRGCAWMTEVIYLVYELGIVRTATDPGTDIFMDIDNRITALLRTVMGDPPGLRGVRIDWLSDELTPTKPRILPPVLWDRTHNRPLVRATCHLCVTFPVEVRYRPCKHMVCYECAARWHQENSAVCPMCRGAIQSKCIFMGGTDDYVAVRRTMRETRPFTQRYSEAANQQSRRKVHPPPKTNHLHRR
jgi:hypothetical protein